MKDREGFLPFFGSFSKNFVDTTFDVSMQEGL
jgi:hypothetical protein